ncbi:pilus assembly protein PilP [Acidithiobacillus concretivorus]|uniref:Pilus assembly protein PilP n=1 Tax=Acidithiobacillus concretivorus TaxID=3063952 RepID=A0ABS5ZSV6_9PROT|nr:pilus assembly protein PilP [Acidithiobacillus concretivorus]MBU2739750.1 pilus assembly protein PilP [Acidithiobacillus concretivorus]
MKTSGASFYKNTRHILAISVTLALLAGCSDSDDLSHLRNFVANGPKTNNHITPLPKTPAYEPVAYNNPTNRDPFTSFSEMLLRKEAASEATGPHPVSHGPMQPLEKYSLSSLSVSGIMRTADGQLWAVIQAPDAKVYRATLGSYIGTHDGRITGIDDRMGKQSVTVEQYLPNAFGGYKKQQTVLHMQSGN